ncbi:hypothetical protein ACOSP7_012113 [Xanthoceras sorbifolium]|uniref:Uncharacterized protein n=1 Tax=Xanthoceras sorbifolium TaxID=99658 RepID=A0ABQ8GZA4_9ROSI|nr:hypothetical protein JRO89_XSUnG0168100 [Xanthoceras sorbifolium]
MGFVGSFEWVNSYGKKHCKSLFWRVRAALKRAVKNGGKKQFKFQYDPSSYALNFDDGGGCKMGLEPISDKHDKFQDCSDTKNMMMMWVCVVLVEKENQ